MDTEQDQKENELKAGLNRFDSTIQDDFKKIPSSPIAYWVSDPIKDIFSLPPLAKEFKAVQGFKTGNNDLFLRYWFEVTSPHIYSYNKNNYKWVLCNKGGEFKKW